MATGDNLSRTLEGGHQSFYEFPCSLCEEQGKHVEATKYCEECFVYICDNCMRTIHNRIPLNTRHKLLDQGQFSVVSQYALKSFPTNRCLKHQGELVNIFCGNHDIVCCSVCKVLEHSTCNKTQHLPDAAKGIKTSTEYQFMRKETQIFLSDLNKLLNDKTADRSRVEKEMQDVKRTINDFRKKVNKFLDDLELKSLNELTLKETSIFSGLEKDRQFLDKTKNEAEDILQRLNSFKGDNECELFFRVKTCKCFIEEYTERVEHMSSTATESLVFKIDASIEKYLRSLHTLGRFVDRHSVTVQYSTAAISTSTRLAQLPDSKVAAPRRKDQTTKPTDNKSGKSEDNSRCNDIPSKKDMNSIASAELVGARVEHNLWYGRSGTVTTVHPDGTVDVKWDNRGTDGPYKVGTGLDSVELI